MPEGFRYRPELIGRDEEQALVRHIEALPFKPFEFHGYTGARRVVSFGWRYDFARHVLEPAAAIPDFLLPLRDKVAAFSGLEAEAFRQVLVLEYAPGAGIGWHRDRPQFREIAGVSLLAACPFRLRRRRGEGWDRATARVEPRSAYMLDGPSRTDWEHSIPPLDALRYSVTFRTFR
ncbi:MAG: alpha-ketoglutarate-dependent dioxygenase AlkB [Caulobacter sp.]|nr:alpha-ketoglutarate-dependent dioxygenase AlkB [Caulobacter sp.]